MAAAPKPFDVEAMKAQARKATELLGAIGNENRLMILCHLVQGERSVNELAGLVDVAQPTVSQHLAVLRRQGLVEVRHQGSIHIYSLAGREARDVIGTLQALYCDPDKQDD